MHFNIMGLCIREVIPLLTEVERKLGEFLMYLETYLKAWLNDMQSPTTLIGTWNATFYGLFATQGIT